MARSMNKGKQQVLLGYLPGRTFDFPPVIAQVTSVRGSERRDLNRELILRRVAEDVRAWPEPFRPSLMDRSIAEGSDFVLIDPSTVDSQLFPRVLWCQNRSCGMITDLRGRESMPRSALCTHCRTGRLTQIRFVKVHRCGHLEPLTPAPCQTCHSAAQVALDTRGSERIADFTWVCRRCQSRTGVFPGYCTACQWPGDTENRRMSILPHRAGQAFYPQNTVLLNVPSSDLDSLFRLGDWELRIAAKFLRLSPFGDQSLHELAADSAAAGNSAISNFELDDLLAAQSQGQLSPEELVARLRAKRDKPGADSASASELVEQRSGVGKRVWANASQEILDLLVARESTKEESIATATQGNAAGERDFIMNSLGLSRISLISDFPIVTATYGFTRVEHAPNVNSSGHAQCRLNAFAPDRQLGGRFPIFVDKIQADAILISLDPSRVTQWLRDNGCTITLPGGADPNSATVGYFVQLFDSIELRATISGDRAARLVFGLLHTLSHLCVRGAALLCGLDRTSLAEYLFPRTLGFAIYCNHRFGATIGALTALFEQCLNQWLAEIIEAAPCLYDPVCSEHEGSCHACAHLSETSCRHFNLNLNRAFLFGGHDEVLGTIAAGFVA